MKLANKTKPFRSAKAEVQELTKLTKAQKQKIQSPSYQLAFIDQDFLLRKPLRSIRLQLELLKPEMFQQEEHIESTVVIFGSARIPELSKAKKQLAAAKRLLKTNPKKLDYIHQVKVAESMLEKSHYYNEARRLGQIISQECQKDKIRRFVIVTGGGPGIMEAANRGAHDVKAKSIGHTIVLPFTNESAPNPYISPELCFQFHYFAMRKMHFLIRALAAVFFPGGFGTFDELFETLTLLQTRKITPIPILLFGKEFWQRMINFEALADEGLIAREDQMLYQFVETAEEAWQAIANFYQLPYNK